MNKYREEVNQLIPKIKFRDLSLDTQDYVQNHRKKCSKEAIINLTMA